jgi:hypothetical protein
MICPRCGNEWDATRGPCPRCGLVVRIPGQSGAMGRSIAPPSASNMQQAGGMPATPAAKSQPDSVFFPPKNIPSQPSNPSPGSAMAPPPLAFPFAEQTPDMPRTSFNASRPETPRFPAPSPSTPGFENNGILNRSFSQTQQSWPDANSASPTSTPPGTPSARNVPHRPQSPQTASPISEMRISLDAPAQELQRPLNVAHGSRLVTDPLGNDFLTSHTPGPIPSIRPLQQDASSTQQGASAFPSDAAQLSPGTLLRRGRYRLQKPLERQEWLSGVRETMWLAQDAQRNASLVMIREVILPENSSFITQSTVRTATMALTSVGRHPHIATLWNAFGEGGRSFFVFEPIEGESLWARMRRTGRPMAEQEIIECCLQMTEILELMAQESPPLVHGLICPEHIIIGRSGSEFVLTSFSIILAGGATQFISGIELSHLSAYTAPEFARGVIDVRSDLFSLIATAYHAVTGSSPVGVNGNFPQARRLNPNISPQFEAILSKGLRPVASQRYQRPSELRQDLLVMRSVNATLVSSSAQRFEPPVSTLPTMDQGQGKLHFEPPQQASVPDSLMQAFQSLVPAEDIEEHKPLLPSPEELPPLQERNHRLDAALWLSGIMICLLLIVLLSRGFF